MGESTLGTIPAATIGTDTFSAQCSYQAWQSFTLGALSGNNVPTLDGLIVLLERATKNRSYTAKLEKLHWKIATYDNGHILLGCNSGPSPDPTGDSWKFDRRIEVFLRVGSTREERSLEEQHAIQEKWDRGSVTDALVAIDPTSQSAYIQLDEEESCLTFARHVPEAKEAESRIVEILPVPVIYHTAILPREWGHSDQ